MKYIFYFLFIVIISSCSKTSRVDKLIREELKSSLNNPESYKSIGTELDSAFAPYDNPKYSIVVMSPNISYNNDRDNYIHYSNIFLLVYYLICMFFLYI